MKQSLLIFLLIAVMGANTAWAARGFITGRVIENKTNIVLPGANVIIEGTTIGGATNTEGYFFIRAVPPGIYRVRVTMIGYLSALISNVQVSANDTTRLDITLTPSAIEVPAVVVTASKNAQSFMETPASISIVNARQLEQQNQVTLDDVLEFTPGVNMLGGQINIRGSSGYSRGAGSRVLLLVDGVPMLPGDSGDIKWDALMPSEIDHVEIVKGASSALYGGYAMGGVVNVITKDPGEIPQTTVRVSGGLYDEPRYKQWKWTERTLTYNNQNIAHARSFGKLKVRASVGRSESNGYAQNGQYHRFSAYGKAKYNFSPVSNMTVYGNYAQDRHGESITWRDANDPFQVPVDALGDLTFSKKLQSGATYRTVLNRRTTLKLRGSYYRNSFESNIADSTSAPIDAKAQKSDLEAQLDIDIGRRQAITFGAVGTADFIDATLYGNHHSYDFGTYLQHEWKPLATLSTLTSLRYDYHWVDTGLIEYHLNPRIGVVYAPSTRVSLRASTGRGFRAATMAELFTFTKSGGFTVVPNPNLSSEIAWSYEVGAQYIASSFLINSAIFWNDYRDLIEGDFVTQHNQTVIQFLNFNHARIRGAEVEINGQLLRRHLNFDLGYTYLDARELTRLDSQTGRVNTTDRPLAYRPKHLFTISATYSLGHFAIGVDSRHVSRLEDVRVFPDDPRVAQKLTNLRLGANFKPVSITFNVNNAFDYYYTQIERTMEPIRNYVLTTLFNF